MYVISTEIHEAKGRRFKVERIDDSSDGATPWEDDEGAGTVRGGRKDLQHRHRDGEDNKRPGWRPLNDPERFEFQYYYDWEGTMKRARKDGWGMTPGMIQEFKDEIGREPTKRMIVAEAVRRDFQRMKDFLDEKWQYIGVRVSLLTDDGEGDDEEPEFSESLWRVESDGKYWEEVRDELIDTLVHDAHARDTQAAEEAAEVQYWAERDVVTC